MDRSEEHYGAQSKEPGIPPEHQGVAEQLVDLMVYLPIGVATSVAEDLPRFAARGRTAVQERIRAARGIGEVTVVLGRRTLASRLRAPSPGASRPEADPSPGGPTTGVAPRTPRAATSRPATTAPRRVPPSPRDAGADIEIEIDAIIAGYDTLPASQVVRRLESLSPAELADVGRYEAAGRGRRTILHRVRQIQAAPQDPSSDRFD